MGFSFLKDGFGRGAAGVAGKVGRAARRGMVLFLCSCLLLSGCTNPDDTAKKDIELVVDGFLKDVQDGSFAANGFVSEAVTDVCFSGAEFSSERLRDIVNQVMKGMKYTPGIVTASMKEKTGSCSVNVTSLDYNSFLKDTE